MASLATGISQPSSVGSEGWTLQASWLKIKSNLRPRSNIKAWKLGVWGLMVWL